MKCLCECANLQFTPQVSQISENTWLFYCNICKLLNNLTKVFLNTRVQDVLYIQRRRTFSIFFLTLQQMEDI
jgi:hypothetical protein